MIPVSHGKVHTENPHVDEQRIGRSGFLRMGAMIMKGGRRLKDCLGAADWSLQSRKGRFWFAVAVVLSFIAVTAYVTSFLYVSRPDPVFTDDSDPCVWSAMAQQFVDAFPNFGLIRMNFSRGVGEFAFHVPFVWLFGVGLVSTFAMRAVFAALHTIFLALAVSLVKEEDGSVRFFFRRFVLTELAISAVYTYNTGHEMTYAIVAMGLFVFCWRFDAALIRHALLFLVSFLGYLNDDVFAVQFVVPILAVNAFRYLGGENRIDKGLLSVVGGVVSAKVVLMLLVSLDVMWLEHSPVRLVRFSDLGQWFVALFDGCSWLFRIGKFSGKELNGVDMMALGSYALLCAFSIAALIWAVWVSVRNRFSRNVEFPAVTAFSILLYAAVFCILDFPTKKLPNPNKRYLYFEVVKLVLLLSSMVDRKFIARRANALLIVLLIACFGFSFSDDILHRIENCKRRGEMLELIQTLKKENLTTTYSDYWIAQPLTVASGNQVRSYPIRPYKGKIYPRNRNVVDSAFANECHAYILTLEHGHKGIPPPAEIKEMVYNTFGSPDRCLKTKRFEVLVYKKNIAFGLPPPPQKKKK